jgi:protein kinase A
MHRTLSHVFHEAQGALHNAHLPSHNSKPTMSATERKSIAEQEKQFVAHFSDQHDPLPPEEVQQDPRNKDLGRSSRALGVSDFELVRTLGTGACCCLLPRSYMMRDV